MGELTSLVNIASKLEAQLQAVGIITIQALKEAGSREAWLRILAMDSSACIQRLYALEGAVEGIPRRQLGEDTKASLREFYRQHKG